MRAQRINLVDISRSVSGKRVLHTVDGYSSVADVISVFKQKNRLGNAEAVFFYIDSDYSKV